MEAVIRSLLSAAVILSVKSQCVDWRAHPNGDCTKYNRCVGDIVYEKVCPAQLYFNPYIKVCDWPWNVKCNGTGPKPALPPGTTAASLNKIECPAGVNWGRFPNLFDDCRSFFECEEGKRTQKYCSEGLLFNFLILSCDLPQNVFCPRIQDNKLCFPSSN